MFTKRRFVALALVLSVPAAFAQMSPAPNPITYPATRQVEQIDTYHGTQVADPYRWLEDDNSADTKAWVQAQNVVTERYLQALPQRLPVRKLYTALFDFERFGVPTKAGSRYFWTRNDGLQQQAVLYTAKSLDEAPTVALDPNTLSKDGTVALSNSVPSRDGRMLAYGVSNAGSDWQHWRVRDTDSGADLPDRIEWVKFSSVTWTLDGKGFFYSRYDAPAAGTALTGANYFQKLYYHRLGTAQAEDQLVMQNGAEKEWRFSTTVSHDGRWLIVAVGKVGKKNGLMALPLPGGAYLGTEVGNRVGTEVGNAAAGTPQPLTLDFDASYIPVAVNGDTLVVHTDLGASRGRLLAIALKQPARAGWKTLVPEGADTIVAARAVGGHYVLRFLRDASTVVRVHKADGAFLREVALPGVGTADGFGGRWDDSETFFSYTSLNAPAEVWRYDVASGRATLFKRPKTAFDATQFETRREFVTSKDGTRFPVFIAHRKGLKLDGSNPTLLYGYGGFNVPTTPGYNITAATWMAMGGVYVAASIRGGGEYGDAWHQAGTKLHKQNVFDDFIAAAEWLIAQKITSPDRLAVNGGSNGGLLVGAVVNQRPELFGVALPSVGVMDMLRFQKFTIGWAWVSDYGSSDDAAQFKALAAYSPLHNIRPGKPYPAIMVTTGDHDDRVVPAHSFKYAAALQAAATGAAPKLIRIETQAGHGAGKPTSKIIEERADMLAFAAQRFGMGLP